MLFLLIVWTYETGLPPEARIPGFRGSALPVISGTGKDTVYSSTPQYGSEEPVSVPGCYTDTSRYTGRPEGPRYGLRSRARLVGLDF